MRQQVDPAVEFGIIPPPIPDSSDLDEMIAESETPPELISGILHQGCKMILGGTSKSNKSWCLLDLALSVASGRPWWGRPCEQTRVLYLNFELPQWALASRINAICRARQDLHELRKFFRPWNLRGHAADAATLRPKLQRHLDLYEFGLIVIDPAYKLLGNRDENANGDIAELMNEFEALAYRYEAAVAIAHHFAKGNAAAKDPIDRMSGAGAWARDPDSIVVLTPHEEPNCFTVSTILRNHPQVPEFVVAWDYPLMRAVAELNPASLRTPQSAAKICTDQQFISQVLTSTPKSRGSIVAKAAELGLSARTTDRYLSRLANAGIICSGSGLYWVKNH